MSKRRAVLLGVCSIPITGVAGLAASGRDATQDRARRGGEARRDRELFLDAADELAAGRHVRARLLLNTLLSVYADSSFAQQARLLLFYSTATTYPALYEGKEVLDRVEEYLKELEAADRNRKA